MEISKKNGNLEKRDPTHCKKSHVKLEASKLQTRLGLAFNQHWIISELTQDHSFRMVMHCISNDERFRLKNGPTIRGNFDF